MEERLIGIDLSVASKEVISMLLDDPPDGSVYWEIYRANQHRPEVLRLMYEHPGTPYEVLTEVSKALSLPVKSETEVVEARRDYFKEETQEERVRSIFQRIQRLSVGEKIQLALKGGKEVRSILIRDANKEVVLKVLENPKITESEVEMAARNPQLPQEALRFIAKKRDWIRRYPIMYALVSNPKTPPGISTQFISHLRNNDLVILEKNKSIPDAVRNAVKRYLKMRKK
jgi:hypothetical protein